MHLSDGVLPVPELVACAVLAAGGVAIGLRRLREPQLPAAGLLGAAFFVASTLHLPVGVGSVHLILNGLAGLLLGWAVFPVMLMALLLQAVLFGFGGLGVLGANLLIMATPGVLAHALLFRWLAAAAPDRRVHRAAVAGALAGMIGIGGTAALAALLLAVAGGSRFLHLIGLLLLAHVPVLLVEAVIGALALSMLARLLPQALVEALPR